MPIPKVENDSINREQLIKKYEDEGGHKTIEFDWVAVDGRTRQPTLRRYVFNADTIQCDNGECNQFQMTFVRLMPTGVYWHCGSCRKTDGFISFEAGRELTQFRRQLTPPEAWEIIRESGQQPPVGLERPVRGRRFRITG
jgi:hypothetical protein